LIREGALGSKGDSLRETQLTEPFLSKKSLKGGKREVLNSRDLEGSSRFYGKGHQENRAGVSARGGLRKFRLWGRRQALRRPEESLQDRGGPARKLEGEQ